MKRVYLWRHGMAEPYCANDAGRHLVQVGKDQVSDVASQLKQLKVQEAWVSPYVRAQETFEIIQANVSIGSVVSHDGITPHGQAQEIWADLLASEADSILLVTHNPFVTELAHLLISDQAPKNTLYFDTADCMEIHFDQDIQMGEGQLIKHYQASQA